jgi:hypothetical protein
VTYTFLVQNTGSFPVSEVTLSDNQLGSIKGPDAGDTDSNGILDIGETWTYSSTTTLTTTTTNQAAASGKTATGSPVASPDSNAVTVVVGGSIPTPEFPTIALPMALIVGMLGAVLFIKRTKEN